MGGYGSTRWKQHVKKGLVEETIILSIRSIGTCHLAKGSIERILSWSDRWTNTVLFQLRFTIETEGDGKYAMQANYRGGLLGENVSQRIPIVTMPIFEGMRLWLKCPNCDRRRTKLYLPYQGRFACRKCHDLAYRSSQESRRPDSVDRLIAAAYR